MAQYKFVTNGDYIDFYVDSQLVVGIPINFTSIGWVYDVNPGITFGFYGTSYHTDNLSDILFNGVPLASQVGFKTALGELFPHFANSGAIPDFNQVLAQGGAFTINRIVDLNGNLLEFINGEIKGILQIPGEYSDNAAALAAGVPNNGFYFTTDGTERIVKLAHD